MLGCFRRTLSVEPPSVSTQGARIGHGSWCAPRSAVGPEPFGADRPPLMAPRRSPATGGALQDLPPCFSAPPGLAIGCEGPRPDIPLRSSFLSQLRRMPLPAAPALAVDVGANDAAWSYWLRQLASRHAPRHDLRIVMFDPQERVAKRLSRVAVSSNLTFLPVAAWTRGTLQAPESLAFFSTSSTRQSSLALHGEHRAGQLLSKRSVPGIDLAAWLAREASAHTLLMLKIDVRSRATNQPRSPHARSAAVPRDATRGAQSCTAPARQVEGAEYQLLPHLLTHGALCLPTHLIVEWHLNYMQPEKRLAALSLRLSLNATLRSGCARPPILVHEEDWHNNRWRPVPGLTTLVAAHNSERPPKRKADGGPRTTANVEYPST